jgi:ribose 5-phosphate isomerase B
LVTSVEDAILTKEHNNSNCLALGQKNVSKELAEKIVTAWLNASFAGGRHERRVEKIKAIEVKKYE